MILYVELVLRGGCFFVREKIVLVCTECLSRNYTTTKDKYSSTQRLEITKYCKKCNKHTVHRESK